MSKPLYRRGGDTPKGLSGPQYRLLRKLSTPQKINAYLATLPPNYEKGGETHRSVYAALEAKKAHCIEAALIAAAALWIAGGEPLLVDLRSDKGDYDHVLALYRVNDYWGALSKSNHATIRSRAPVYKTQRELVMSYFHEWFPERGTDKHAPGTRTLRSYSKPLNMKKFGTEWITSDKDLWWLDKELNKLPHYAVAPTKNLRLVPKADKMEIKAGSLLEWSKKDART